MQGKYLKYICKHTNKYNINLHSDLHNNQLTYYFTKNFIFMFAPFKVKIARDLFAIVDLQLRKYKFKEICVLAIVESKG